MEAKAMEVVLSIPELLETILLHLNMATLLVSAQRVSKQWLTLITASSALQKALYFKPVSPSQMPQSSSILSEDNRPRARKTGYTQNPLLLKYFQQFFFNTPGEHQEFLQGVGFRDLSWRINASGETLKLWNSSLGNPEPADEMKISRWCQRFTRAGASWRRMLVSQPAPACQVYLWRDAGTGSNTMSQGVIDLSPRGLSMGYLYDFVQHRVHSISYTSHIRVFWDELQMRFVDDKIDTCNEFLQFGVVVEEERVPFRADLPAVVEEQQVLDRAFRCEDFRPDEVHTAEVEW